MTDVEVTLPRALLALFPGCPARTTVMAGTVGDVLTALDAAWPGMRDRLCEPAGLRRHIRVFVDGEPARLDTRLRPGAEVFVMTAISGG